MRHYSYIIVGGGMTADAAVRGIRQVDETGSIGLFSREEQPPYNRPPLSKALWKGKPLQRIWRQTDQLGVDLHLGISIESLDPGKKQVTDDRFDTYSYDKLLLATGGHPIQLSFDTNEVIYFRYLADYQRLRDLVSQKEQFAVLGGGYIGSEIAAALQMNDKEVIMLFPEQGIGARTFPNDLSEYLNEYFREKGVAVFPGEMVHEVKKQGDHFLVQTDLNDQFTVDTVVAGLGIQPSTELAQKAGLEVGQGILVDDDLRTSNPDIYAAGDVASFYNRDLDRRIRMEHEDNANTMGQLAGANMARSLKGEPQQPYHHLPFFYSDLFELGYEAVGELDSRLETVSDWQTPYKKGIVYYLSNGRVRGVLLWDVWNQVDAARQLIASPGPYTAENVKGLIPFEK